MLQLGCGLIQASTVFLTDNKQRQKSLFEDRVEKKHRCVDKAVDAIRKRFGKDAVKRGQ